MQPEEKELFLRVHRKHDHGVLTSRGFLSSAESPLALSHHASARYPGSSGLELEQSASTHVTQWINCTWDQPSPFVSMARSVPYVLFESRRWDLLHSANQPHISIIDAAKLIQTTDIWLATDLLEDKYQQDVFFACRAEEVLAYSRIPLDAVVATVPLNSFFDCLPPWCEGIKEDIRRDRLWSTAEVADALENLVRQHCNTAAAEKELLEHSVRKSLEILRGTLLPRWMASFNETKHADAIDRIAGFASVFCWWPKWIVGNDASGYPALLEAVRGQVVQRCARKGPRRK
jgi:hypothetical protein